MDRLIAIPVFQKGLGHGTITNWSVGVKSEWLLLEEDFFSNYSSNYSKMANKAHSLEVGLKALSSVRTISFEISLPNA